MTKSVFEFILRTLFACALVAAFAFADRADAETIRGILVNNPQSDLALKIREQNTTLKIEARPAVLASLRRLKDSDLVVGTGKLKNETSSVEIHMVQSVGLREIVGAWKSASWEIFEFFDFNSLNLYVPQPRPNGDMVLTKTHELSYYIAPQGNQLSLFIALPQRVMFGKITIRNQEIVITVFNPETGTEEENISLSPLTLN